MSGADEHSDSPERNATTNQIYCPACRYGVYGLPEYHACPECGTGFDPHMVIIHVRPGLRGVRYAGLALLTLLFLGPWLFEYFLRTGSTPVWMTQDEWEIMSMGIGILFLSACFAVPLFYWRQWRVIINWKGVVIYRRKRCIGSVSWSELDRAKVHGSGILFVDSHGHTSAVFPSKHTGGRGTRLRCVSEINRLAALYRDINLRMEQAPREAKGVS